jgi:hypothetical protein
LPVPAQNDRTFFLREEEAEHGVAHEGIRALLVARWCQTPLKVEQPVERYSHRRQQILADDRVTAGVDIAHHQEG